MKTKSRNETQGYPLVSGTAERNIIVSSVHGPACPASDVTNITRVSSQSFPAKEGLREVETFGEAILGETRKRVGWFKFTNYCRHLKRTLLIPPVDTMTFTRASEEWQGPIPFHNTDDNCRAFGKTQEVLLLSNGSLHQVESFQTLMSRSFDAVLFNDTESFWTKVRDLDRLAVQTMVPRLDDGFSLPVFLAELKDLPGMIFDALKWTLKFPVKLKALWRKPLKEISGSWLAAIFGWLPFVSDIKSIVTKIMNLSKTIDKFLDNAGKRMTMHYEKRLSPKTFMGPAWELEEVEYHFEPENVDLFHNVPESIFRKISIGADLSKVMFNVVYHATMDYAYHVSKINRSLQRFLAGLDVFGINASPSDVWEMIPFSFVVDWFTNVGKSLKTLDLTNVPVQLEIFDFCRSIKYECAASLKNHRINLFERSSGSDESGSWTVSPGSPSPIFLGKGYHRWPGIPELASTLGLELKTPKGLQIVTACALLGQYFG